MNEHSTGGLKVIWICVGVSVLAHVALALASPGILSIFKQEIKKPKKKKVAKREVVISLIPKAQIARVAIPEPLKPKLADNTQDKKLKPKPVAKKDTSKLKPKPKPKELFEPREKLAPKVVRTSDDQLAGIPEETHLLGERDTIASSNAKVDPNAADRAAIKGEESTFNETTNTHYQDGDLAHMNRGAKSKENTPEKPTETEEAPEQNPTELADKAVAEAKSSIVESQKRGEAFEKKEKKQAREASVLDDEVKKYLESENKTLAEAKRASAQIEIKKKSDKPMDAEEAQEEQNTIANKEVDPNALKQKAEKQKRVKKKRSEPKKKVKNVADNGFRSEAKATRFEGSISRRSKSGSNNVKATPLGKYMAEVSKLVEREWQRRCSLKGDLIQPGTLRMGFILDNRGKILRIYTISQTYGSEMNRSITFQAINSAKLPPMPTRVRAIQNGDPIEFIYTFAF